MILKNLWNNLSKRWKCKTEDVMYKELPKTCIHNAEGDGFSKLYLPREKCDCGYTKWITEGYSIVIAVSPSGIRAHMNVHRCEGCHAVRMADLV